MSNSADSGESLFSRAVDGLLLRPLTFDEMAELRVDGANGCDEAKRLDFRHRLDRYVKGEGGVRLETQIANKHVPSIGLMGSFGPNKKFSEIRTHAWTDKIHTCTPNQFKAIVKAELKHGPLGKGLCKWAGLEYQEAPPMSLAANVAKEILKHLPAIFGGHASTSVQAVPDKVLSKGEMIKAVIEAGFNETGVNAKFDRPGDNPWLDACKARHGYYFEATTLKAFEDSSGLVSGRAPGKAGVLLRMVGKL